MLEGKKVFVSGGTGFLGEAIVAKCCSYGAGVIFSYHSKKERAQELAERHGARAVKLDLKDVPAMSATIDELLDETGAIDILINNAGVSQVMPFSLMDEGDYDFLMDVNVKGTVFLTKAILRGMIREKRGSIVNIGSIAGQRILEVPVHYAISKAAINGFTYALASEVKRYGIRVNSVLPGMIEGGVAEGIPDDLKQDFIQHCASARPGTAEEVAETVCFIASDRSSYTNGQNIVVDGGI